MKLGGHLVTVNDSLENKFVSSILLPGLDTSAVPLTSTSKRGFYWIGFHQPGVGEGDWIWSDKSNSQYLNWFYDPNIKSQEPNQWRGVEEDYAAILYGIQPETKTDTRGNWVDYINESAADQGQIGAGISETPFIRRGDSGYVIVSGPTWEEAEANAVKLGGHLVTINDKEENEWITKTFKDANKGYEPYPNNPQPINGDVYWNGLYKTSGAWKWSSGETFSFSQWGANRPSGDWSHTSKEAVEMIIDAYPDWSKNNSNTE